jgi:hypothetical protein
MSTYTSPITLAAFQTYLRDSSTDATLTGFYQTLIDTATEYVYNWLDRDYTASASKTDIFWGDDSNFYAPRHQAGTLLTWVYVDASGTVTTVSVDGLMLRANGFLIQASVQSFQSGVEHRLTYQQPSSLVCPETVKQVITEFAALLFEASNQGAGTLGLLLTSSNSTGGTDREHYLDLTERHKEMLRPYKRYAV